MDSDKLFTNMQVYDLTLEAALRAQSCGSRQLLVTGEWSWLLSEFAVTYGIRESYASLSHLRWVLRYDIPLSCMSS
jgi:hypothetical protein